MSKYGNRKTVVDNVTFDSQREASRYVTLRTLQRAGEIRELELQPEFRCVVNGVKVCSYKADFRYKTRGGKPIVEDSKGFRTTVYRLKRKLVQALFGIEIMET